MAMASEQQVGGEGTQKQKTVDEVLAECETDRRALNALVDPLLQDLWTESLRVLEELFPHTKGDKSANEAKFQAARFRILNKGNALKRRLPMILSDFHVTQLRVREITVHEVKGVGIHKLPAGVRMPSDRR